MNFTGPAVSVNLLVVEVNDRAVCVANVALLLGEPIVR